VWGTVGNPTHHFIDKNKQRQEISFLEIKIWEKIPEGFKDIIFYHEFMEGKFIKQNLKQDTPHNLSVIKTRKYIDRFLSREEKDKYKSFIKRMQPN
jgi:hypothetical protein